MINSGDVFQGKTGVGHPIPLPRTIRFSSFELDVRTGELRKNGIKIRLHEQPLRILLILLVGSRRLVPAAAFHGFERF